MTEEDGYVDIHGRDIPDVFLEKTGEIAFPLSELRQTGMAIYLKSQYAKLATIEMRFDQDFDEYMCEMAGKFMKKNRIKFTDDQIMKGIINCKKLLAEIKPVSHNFYHNKSVGQKLDNELTIKVSKAWPSPKSPQSSRANITIGNRSVEQNSDNELTIKVRNTGVSTKSPQSSTFVPKSRIVPKILKHNQITTPIQENGIKSEVSNHKLRSPKTTVLKKIALDEQKEVDHDVIVTCFEKPNCFWVRDKANDDIFEKVFKMANEEGKFQKVVPPPRVYEKVYLAEDDGYWFRCKLRRFSPLTAFFLDYGNVAVVDCVKEASEELAKIPCLAVRLTFREVKAYTPRLEDELKISILKQNEDGTYFVSILEVNGDSMSQTPPRNSDQCQEDSPPKHQGAPVKQEEKPKAPPKFTKLPPPLCTLDNDQTVIIFHEEDGILFLRTKACVEKLRDINQECDEFSKVAPPCDTYDVAQLVLIQSNDGKFYRGVVKNIHKNKIEVDFLDYVNKASTEAHNLRSLNESLSLQPIPYFKGRRLKRFTNVEFNDEAKDFILESILNRKKYTVILNANGDFDLFDGLHRLSDQLQELHGTDEKIRHRDIKRFEPQTGITNYICGVFKDSSDLKLVPVKEYMGCMDFIEKHEKEMGNSTPYKPVVGEVCFCFYGEEWYRCVVIRILNAKYEVLFLDFGNIEIIRGNDMRKAPKDIVKIPSLAVPSRLVDLPDHPEVNDLLKSMIIVGEVYKVNVKSIIDGKCNVEMPLVYKTISQTKKF